jgi:uncharacterized protein (DUF1778 family)
MARPLKDPSLKMDVDLRVPVTADQKTMIYEAAKADQLDVAAWVRPILLDAARSRLEKVKTAKRGRK